MIPGAEALIFLVFIPLLSGMAALVLGPRGVRIIVLVATITPLIVLLGLWPGIRAHGLLELHVTVFAPPLGIALRADPLAAMMLALSTWTGFVVSLHALTVFAVETEAGRRFWPLWLILLAGINGALLSADLFNLYVTLELVTLSAIGLIAVEGRAAAMTAAMRYLLLAMMGSLAFLAGVAILYGHYGVLDLYQLSQLTRSDRPTMAAISMIGMALLIKSAIFPLHIWLPAAHANAAGPVSAILSALVVKISLYMLYRIWFWSSPGIEWTSAATLLGLLGVFAIVYGSVAAYRQARLKLVVAYSTVAQLGYLMLVFPLAGVLAFQAVTLQILAHGLAKAAMFLAAANMLSALGTDRIRKMGELDRKLPLDVFAFALAGITIAGIPPSGGFLAKWMLLAAAREQGQWLWMIAIIGGGLLATAYVFRVLALTCFHPHPKQRVPLQRKPHALASISALVLALLAIALGFAGAPIGSMLELGLPPGILVISRP